MTECMIMQSVSQSLSYLREDEYKENLVSGGRSLYEQSLSNEISSLITRLMSLREDFIASISSPYDRVYKFSVIQSLKSFRSSCEEVGAQLEEYGVHSICLMLLYQLVFQYINLLQDSIINILVTSGSPNEIDEGISQEQAEREQRAASRDPYYRTINSIISSGYSFNFSTPKTIVDYYFVESKKTK
jgi:hypothetical protein